MKNSEIRKWQSYAEDDLRTAEFLLKNKRPVVHTIFHCHESLEKYLKAVIIYQKKAFPYTHDLEILLSVCTMEEKDELALSNIVIVLKNLYPLVRYPGADNVSNVNAREAVEKSLKAEKIILKYLRS